MFDRLEDLLRRYEEIMNELNEPTVTANQDRFRALMKEQSDLTPIVESYREYKKAKRDAEDISLCWNPNPMKKCANCSKKNTAKQKRIQELEQGTEDPSAPQRPQR